jgi:hypothetical protein
MRWIKAPLRAAWRGTVWIRRPLAGKLDAFLARAAARAIEPALIELRALRPEVARMEAGLSRLDHLGPLHEHLAANRRISEDVAIEANLLMDGLLREITRLQLQVEELRERLDAPRGTDGQTTGRFGLVADSEIESGTDALAG